ncbi:hypothetical protein HA464_04870 [Rhizobium leguminosarum bv. trifolii]|uniref:hypothetical protein n=1 Tax=Rhizobium ruizarguesonis TaxID=2081791 RepID=UPI000462BCA7|nr:hypothetical protein [Rhizobium ruizarguesonis]MBY5806028.1 hypothetical protein [Rhizobium leguminosarum]NKL13996.1 hypothetical protein [Rhizobium leguminosarum bv. viciae]QIO43392.1 hypothetical protein HA464_04870 [Rhizobium leguminosarum bv. trifolii]MBY5846749.1 hypothetical protein [Rhizobium leguminosarum]NEH87613.1 hypothetical protein [Rhizobium ruizarguesonis]
MNWLRSCFCRAALVCIALTACVSLSATKPEAPVYDVRSAVVLSGPNMPAELLSGINDRVNAAINATVHDTVLPRVVLTIRVVSIQKGLGFQKDRNVAKISIDAASVEDGSVIAVSAFDVTSIAADPKLAHEILAEDVAARIRSVFSLSGRGR